MSTEDANNKELCTVAELPFNCQSSEDSNVKETTDSVLLSTLKDP